MARVAIPLGLTTQATRPSTGERVRLSGPTMGVAWSVQAVLSDGHDAEDVRDPVQARLNQIVRQMSQWEPVSDLSRFNAAPTGAWIDLPDDFWRVLTHGLELAAHTEGAFDPTLGRLVDLWGFGAGGERPTPSDGVIADALSDGGWRRLPVDIEGRRIQQPGGLHLDLSGIAKGYGVDAVADLLAEMGVAAWLVEIGGELRGAGVKPDGEPWWVEIETPPGLGNPPEPIRLALHGLAVATSGDYRRGRDEGGRRIAHTLDPRTGRPLADAPASVTVIHAGCMQADALCTALAVLGPERGLAFAEETGVAAHFISRSGRERFSSAFAAMLD